MRTHEEAVKLIWDIAELLRGPYRPPQYERVMLPMTVLRRFDSVLEATKEETLAEYERLSKAGRDEATIDRLIQSTTKYRFHNHSKFDFQKLLGDPENLAQHLESYIQGFSVNVRRIFDFFEFRSEIARMSENNILFLIVRRFSEVDLHPQTVDNIRMGMLFEELIRRFNEQANETAGDYFTPREVIRLMVDLLFMGDDDALRTPETVRELLDPACGTGGMLSEAKNHVRRLNPQANLFVYGQDFNPRAYAIAASDLLMKEQMGRGGAQSQVEYGDSFLDDKYPDRKFDYFLANPPFGVDWKRQKTEIERESQRLGFKGRFGAGVPRVSDGALLFLQHMWSKRQDVDERGSRLAIVFNGSPLFSGGADSGESNIRKWVFENDWLEAIVALPEQMFYNTGIATYVWVLSNRKVPARKGKIQLIDARERWVPMRKSLGQKRRKLGEGRKVNELTGEVESNDPRDDISDIGKEYGNFQESVTSKVLDNDDFGYTRVTVERPLRLRYRLSLGGKERFLNAAPHLLDDIQAIDKALGREPYLDWNEAWEQIQGVRKANWTQVEAKIFRDVFTERDPEAEPVGKAKGKKIEYEPDSELRDFENIPLKVDIDQFFKTEVKPHVPDAWMDRTKDKIGYEINFNRLFYVYTPPRPLKKIDAELRVLEQGIVTDLGHLLGDLRTGQKAFYNELDELFIPGTLTETGEARWPKKGQKLFRAPTEKTPKNARAVVHWLNNDYPFALKDTTFKAAGELLTEAILQGGDGTDPDRFAFPIIYLYRHATELLLKGIIASGQHIGLIGRDNAVAKVLEQHALYPLWNQAKVAIASLPVTEDNDAIKAAEALVAELHQADPDGQSLRFEQNKKGRPNVVKLPPAIDLINLRKVFQGLWGFLETSEGIMSDMENP